MIRLTLVSALLLPTVASAAPPPERDRASILAMAGTFKVTFDMRETVAFVPGYQLLPPKRSGGHEVVRVIEDRPKRIVLQHLLVVGDAAAPIVVKHWRQDWTWEPQTILAYTARNRWTLQPVASADRSGAWSQTVWQTDDSPRYGAVGRWRYDGGVARWTSAETRRPLARRDATRHPPYDHYVGQNRHALTADGWVHEQDNAKRGTKDGAAATYAHETVLNSYVPAADFPVGAANRYWSATSAYWKDVRAAWDQRIVAGRGLALAEEPDAGSITGARLMGIADALVEGKATAEAARRDAEAVIAAATSRPALQAHAAAR